MRALRGGGSGSLGREALGVFPLGAFEPEPEEREVALRDRAHYQAYQALVGVLILLWLLSSWKVNSSRLLAWLPLSPALLFYGIGMAAILLSQTPPQAILLWTEPSMAAELDAEA